MPPSRFWQGKHAPPITARPAGVPDTRSKDTALTPTPCIPSPPPATQPPSPARILLPFLAWILAASIPCPAHAAEPSPEALRASQADSDLEIHEIRQLIRRLFDGGGYEQVVEVTTALLRNPAFAPLPPPPVPEGTTTGTGRDKKTVPPPAAAILSYQQESARRLARQEEREWVWFQQARAQYERGRSRQRRDILQQAARAFALLAENRRRFDNPAFLAESRYWAGVAHEALEEWSAAITRYQSVSEANPDPELDVKASLALAKALQVQADRIIPDSIDRSPREDPRPPEERAREQDAMLRQAVNELLKISTAHQMSARREEAELELMQLYLRIQEYGELQRLTESFLSRVPFTHPDYARAAYYRAQAAYWQGHVDEAALLYREALDRQTDNTDAFVDLLYGYGETNARLAQTAAPDMRRPYLQHAQNALRRALQRMPFNDPRRVPTTLRFAEVLIELEEYSEALEEARRILDAAPAAAGYHAGVAAQGLGDTRQAVLHFRHVLLDSRAEADPQRQLDAMEALARMQEEAGAAAEALEYYRDAEALAVRLRSFTRVAAMRLGMARCLIGLGRAQPERLNPALGEAGISLLHLLQTANEERPDTLSRGAEAAARRIRVVESWQQTGVENFTRAETLIRQLEGRLAAQLRKDEIDLVRGIAFLAQAEEIRASIPVRMDRRPEDYNPVFALYANAISFFESALVANPRGMLSGRCSYELGRTQYLAGTLSMELADLLRRQDLGTEAISLQQDADKAFRDALRPLAHAVRNLPDLSATRMEARRLLAETHFALGDFEEGLVESRALATDPSLRREDRIAAVRRWAEALAKTGRQEEAVTTLTRYLDEDPSVGIQAARLLLQLQQPRVAYETLQESLRATDGQDVPRPLRAEGLFLGHDIILRHAERLFREPDAQERLRQEARRALGHMILDYPDTPWAEAAAAALGQSLRDAGDWQTAQQEAARLRAEVEAQGAADVVETLQALDIQEALALLEEARATGATDRLDEALALLSRAETRLTRTEPGQNLRARAVRVQGEVHEARGDTEQALRMYQRVFSLHHLARLEADSARLAAAAIYARQRDFTRAVRVLEEGFDQDRLRPVRLDYEAKRRQQEQRE